MREADIEQYLVDRVKALGGEVRKVQWVGRRNAPDRVVFLPGLARCMWVEVKHPNTGHLFPMNAHERAQYREIGRMRQLGENVQVVYSFDRVDRLIG